MPYREDDLRTMRMRLAGLPPATEQSIGCSLEVDMIGKSVWDLMQRCWQLDPLGRPDAQEVLEELGSTLVYHADTMQS